MDSDSNGVYVYMYMYIDSHSPGLVIVLQSASKL